jgi:iron complex transport system ATP-binding protein
MVVVLHDLEHAAWLAHRVAVLHRGRLYAAGAPRACLVPETLRDVFGVEARVTEDADGIHVRVLGPCDPTRFL